MKEKSKNLGNCTYAKFRKNSRLKVIIMNIYQSLKVLRQCAKCLGTHCHEVHATVIPILGETNLPS